MGPQDRKTAGPQDRKTAGPQGRKTSERTLIISSSFRRKNKILIKLFFTYFALIPA
jgi:hypothetical protein